MVEEDPAAVARVGVVLVLVLLHQKLAIAAIVVVQKVTPQALAATKAAIHTVLVQATRVPIHTVLVRALVAIHTLTLQAAPIYQHQSPPTIVLLTITTVTPITIISMWELTTDMDTTMAQ